MHRRAVTIGDDQRTIVGGPSCLIVGLDLVPPALILNGALGTVGVGGCERGAHILKTDAIFEERGWKELDAHRGEGATSQIDVANAADLRKPLLQNLCRRIVKLTLRQGLRGERQNQHWK